MTATTHAMNALMIQAAPQVIAEMKKAKLAEEFINNEAARLEILEVCLAEASRNWEKLAVNVRTSPGFVRDLLNFVAA